jgi:hypothetical protein
MRAWTVIALLAAGTACNSDNPGEPPISEETPPGPRPARIEQMRVVKIAGDQAARVPGPAAPATFGAASAMPQWTTQPLVARIEIVPGSAPASLASTTNDSLYVPPGTLVHWRIGPDCGELFGQTTATDDSAYAYNRWAPGTRAGTCEVTAGRLVGSDIVIDTTWSLEILPGPIVGVGTLFEWRQPQLFIGDTVDLRAAITRAWDAYENPVPLDSVFAWPDSLIGWAWASSRQGTPQPTAPAGHGWFTVVPEPDSTYVSPNGHEYYGRIWLWLPVGDPRAVSVTFYRRTSAS